VLGPSPGTTVGGFAAVAAAGAAGVTSPGGGDAGDPYGWPAHAPISDAATAHAMGRMSLSDPIRIRSAAPWPFRGVVPQSTRACDEGCSALAPLRQGR
jgi:hypothetical protein